MTGFGDFNKIVLEFDSVFWPKTPHFFAIVDGNPKTRGMLATWLNGYAMVKRPVLVGLMNGDAAYDSETMTDQQLKTEGVYFYI